MFDKHMDKIRHLTCINLKGGNSCLKLWQNFEMPRKKIGTTHAIKSHNKRLYLSYPMFKFYLDMASPINNTEPMLHYPTNGID